ncbi:MAG: hypothetical protein ABI702_05015 [Burkholderiales bacterium]
MSQCEQCGLAFYSASASWGDRTCGDCLANQIELSLMLHALGEQRKPMRRATPAHAQEALPPPHVDAPRRSA